MLLARNKQLWNKRTVIGVLAIVLLGLAWWGGTVNAFAGNKIYVATTGNNGNSGSENQPLKTIQKAIDKAEAGDTIYVRGGTYNESVSINKSGTTANPIRLLAYPGELPIIDGRYNLPTGKTARCGINEPKHCFVYTALVSIRGSNWEFSGFKVIRSHGRGIGVSSSGSQKTRNVLIDSCIVDGVRSAGIHVLNAAFVTVQQCDVSHAANYAPYSRGSGTLDWPVIVTAIGSDNVIFRKNKIHENWGEGIASGRNSTHITIEDNVIFDNYALQIYLHRAQDVLVQRNLVYHTNAKQFQRGGNPSSCIVINNEGQFSGSLVAARVKVLNNLVTGCGQGIAIWGSNGSGVVMSDLEISNNVIANAVRNTDSSPIGLLVNPRAKLKNAVIRNNIVLQDSGTAVYLPDNGELTISNNIWSKWSKTNGGGSNNQVTDPQLRNPNQTLEPNKVQVDWFKPKNSSPAIAMNAGPYEYINVAAVGMPDLVTAPIAPSAGNPLPAPDLTQPVKDDPNAPAPVVLYEFNETGGSVVHDSSNNGTPLNMNINNTGATSWTQDGLAVLKPAIIRSSGPARKFSNACRDSGELTIDMWVTPANVQQDGPARILSLSDSTTTRNFTIGQGQWKNRPKDVFDIRLRTNQTNTNGEPSLVSTRGAVKADKTHLFYTRQSDGTTQLYADGAKVATGRVLGKLTSWHAGYSLMLANEASVDRPWLGTYHRVAIYCEALDLSQVLDDDNNTRAAETDLLEAVSPSPDDLDMSTEELDQLLHEFELSPDGNLLNPAIYLPFVTD